MKANRTPAQPLRRLALSVGAAGLCMASLQALAATGLDRDCPDEPLSDLQVDTVTDPVLRSEPADRRKTAPLTKSGVDSEGLTPARAVPAITSRSTLDDLLVEEDRALDLPGDQHNRRSELPPTATRLPGVANEELPRYRRQMYRTDI